MDERQVFPTANPAARRALTATDSTRAKSYYQPYYHYQTYAAAGSTGMTFFGTPYSSAAGGLDDTNMVNAGVLSQRSLEVTAIEVLFLAGAAFSAASDFDTNVITTYAADVRKIFESGHLEFTVNGENRLTDAPLGLFACPTRLYVDGVVYAAAVGPHYRITNIVIPSNTQFAVDLKWKTAVAVSADSRIGVRLIGVESRSG